MVFNERSTTGPLRQQVDQPSAPSLPDMLTPFEIETLRRKAKEGIDFARKAFEKDREQR